MISNAALCRVLCVGQDQHLLRTRCAVLRTAGFEVLSSTNPSQASACAQYFTLRIVVICHSFPALEQDVLEGELLRQQSWLAVVKLLKWGCHPECLISLMHDTLKTCITPDKPTYLTFPPHLQQIILREPSTPRLSRLSGFGE